ncbi:hypothetical protein JNM87_03860 [Candidatus Saccharibacteria bacterium]|nr:hypothetical protein [Candidatus Saccharibacteria bacterium]
MTVETAAPPSIAPIDHYPDTPVLGRLIERVTPHTHSYLEAVLGPGLHQGGHNPFQEGVPGEAALGVRPAELSDEASKVLDGSASRRHHGIGTALSTAINDAVRSNRGKPEPVIITGRNLFREGGPLTPYKAIQNVDTMVEFGVKPEEARTAAIHFMGLATGVENPVSIGSTLVTSSQNEGIGNIAATTMVIDSNGADSTGPQPHALQVTSVYGPLPEGDGPRPLLDFCIIAVPPEVHGGNEPADALRVAAQAAIAGATAENA